MLTFEEYKGFFPDTDLTDEQFKTQLFLAENALSGFVCRPIDYLCEEQLSTYKRALALQVDHVQKHGETSDGLISQNVNGQSATFQTSGKRGDINISPLARSVLWNGGLSVC